MAMPYAFLGRPLSLEEEMLKQKTDFMIFAFVSPKGLLVLELSLWSARSLFLLHSVRFSSIMLLPLLI